MFKWQRKQERVREEQKRLKEKAEEEANAPPPEPMPLPVDGPQAKEFATAAFKEGKYEWAAALFLQAAEFGDLDDEATLHSNRSLALLKAGDASGAMEAANMCIEQRPDWSKGFFRRGEAYCGLEQFERAIQDFEGAAELNLPAVDPVITARIQGAREAIYEQERIVALQEEIQAESEKNQPLTEKQKDEGVRELQAEAEEREREPAVREAMRDAQAFLAAGDIPNAIVKLRRTCRLEPSYYQASSQLGMLLHHTGHSEEAVEYLRKSYEFERGFMSGYTMTGNILELLGRDSEAENVYRKATRTYFDHADAWVCLALVLVKQAKVEEGIAVVREAKKGGPEGKFLNPTRDARLNFVLGYMLQLKGYLSEPAALYLRICAEAMNMLFSYMLVRSYCVAKEAHQAATMLKQMATLRAFQKAAFLQQLSLANWQLDLPQWDTVCNKVSLHKALQAAGPDYAALVPTGYVMPGDYDRFCREVYGGLSADSEEPLFMLKKPYGYGGAGNRLITEVESRSQYAGCLVQSYLRRPMLINSRKFSLRLYVVTLGTNPLKAWICNKGLLLPCAGEYSLDPEHLGDAHRHMSNQKVNSQFASTSADPEGVLEVVGNGGGGGDGSGDGGFMKGKGDHTRTLEVLWVAVRERGADPDAVWASLKAAVAKTLMVALPCLRAVLGDFNPQAHDLLLIPKIIGVDLMLDDDLRVWLLEVNRFPALEKRGAHDGAVKEAVLDAAWMLALSSGGLPGLPTLTPVEVQRATEAYAKVSATLASSGQPAPQLEGSSAAADAGGEPAANGGGALVSAAQSADGGSGWALGDAEEDPTACLEEIAVDDCLLTPQ